MDSKRSLSDSDGGEEKLNVSSCVERVCAIFIMDEGIGVFVLNLEDHADAGAYPIVDLHTPSGHQGFKQKDPNILLQFFCPLCFCVLNGGMMYIFEGVACEAQRQEIYDSGSLYESRSIYCLDLTTNDISKLRKHVTYMSDLEMCAYMVVPKMIPAAVQFYGGRSICVFSTVITYVGDSNIAHVQSVPSDFELFFPNSLTTIQLPQLCVVRSGVRRSRGYGPISLDSLGRLVRQTCHFHLLKSDGQKQDLVPRYQGLTADDELARTSFCITAFSVIGLSTLVVQTDFGVLFSLNLESVPLQWEVFEGSAFPHFYHNFVMDGNKVVLSPGGFSRFSCDGGGSSGGGGVTANVPFPLCSYVSPNPLWRNFAIGLFALEHLFYPLYAPFILQVGQDRFEEVYWTLDMLKIDMLHFNEEEEEEEFGDQFVRRIKSLKFSLGHCGNDVIAEGVYPF